MKTQPIVKFVCGAAALAALSAAGDARACGGFFCSQTQPVNQAAERIVFADNGDGTVTAVIQIMYEGPSENFSWLLPIPTVPEGDDIKVASDIGFQRLQQRTNPSYSLTTVIEGTCKTEDAVGAVSTGSASSGTGGGSAVGGPQTNDGGVTVEASGVVGAFEWTVISLDESLENPAEVAEIWLEDNGYDVSPGSPELIAPYLMEGMYLLALRLTKGADTGSIRPIVLTYDANLPMIPIKLTSVAANEDMGVMTWVLSNARAVPANYLSLELNEARINWFNANSNYNSVVIDAADEAGGQGFVTEYANPADALSGGTAAIWTANDDAVWQSFQNGLSSSFDEMFRNAYYTYGAWDGFWDAVEDTVTLPQDVPFADFKLCPNCYSGEIEFSPSAFLAALEENVITPVRDMQALFDDAGYVTRLYTTMSASDMTLDPLFTFNPDLDDVANLHTADRIIECNPDVFVSEAPWRIEFPQGGVIRGTAQDAATLTWPDATQEQPANIRISQLSDSGEGDVVEDNVDTILEALDAYNDQLGLPGSGSGGSSSSGSTTSGGAGRTSGSTGTTGSSGSDGPGVNSSSNDSSGCSISGTTGTERPLWLAASVLGLGLLGARRRRPRRRSR